MVRRGDREAQQPTGPAGHRHRLFARAVADPDPDGVAFVDERWEAPQAALQGDRARQRLDVESAHSVTR